MITVVHALLLLLLLLLIYHYYHYYNILTVQCSTVYYSTTINCNTAIGVL